MIKYEKLIPYNGEIIRFQFKPKREPYVGQDQIGANKFIINKVKVLNHRWIIADYSDGEMWRYYLNIS
jgi:hypothetical protein